MFVDVILPVPLDGFFTYSVPASPAEQVKVGVRVLVPFGRSKTYVGIVSKTHKGPLPEGFQIKDILQVLDASPILLDSQLRLWQWISEYYLSPIGEVYKAALPSGLKAEDGYKPKTETYIRLTPQFRSEQALHIALDMLQRAPSQLKAFADFLYLTKSEELRTKSYDYIPLFPFGYGLNYTTFKLGKATADKQELTVDDKITFTIPVTNTGAVAGAETIQLYISDLESTVERPVKELKAFRKVFLQPGETQQVSLTIDRSALSFYNDQTGQWTAEPGEFKALIGTSSKDIISDYKFRLK